MRAAAAPRAVVVMGVSGSGKSTVARAVAHRLGWDLVEGDDLHPPANVAKMQAGTPLTGADRAPWLRQVRRTLDEHLAADRPVVLTCSALTRAYRDVLRTPEVLFAYLHGSRELLAARLSARTGHFMPPALLGSQLAILQAPELDERSVTVAIDLDLTAQVATILARCSGPGG